MWEAGERGDGGVVLVVGFDGGGGGVDGRGGDAVVDVPREYCVREKSEHYDVNQPRREFKL